MNIKRFLSKLDFMEKSNTCTKALLKSVKVSMMPCPPDFRSSAGMLSTPGNSPSFSIRIALSLGESVSVFHVVFAFQVLGL